MAKKEFKNIRKRYATDGSPCEYNYVYNVDDEEVLIEVPPKVMHLWNVSVPEIQKAAEELIEAKIKEGWSPRESAHLLLDEFSVEPIARKLGWKARRPT